MKIRALLITPTDFPSLTGNAVTVNRIARQLREGGVEVMIMGLEGGQDGQHLRQAMEFDPQMIHGFHAYKAGRLSLMIKNRLPKAAMITTFTGTDINVDLDDPERRMAIGRVLAHSEGITVFNEQAQARLFSFGMVPEIVCVIHQSVYVPEQSFLQYRSLWKIPDKAQVFLLLGSIRKIKALGFALEVLEEVRNKHRDIHVLMAGQVIEKEEFANIEKLILKKSWITYLGEVGREHIQSLFQAVEVVLNTSFSESESNALLEAMSFGRLVIARDIPGNASVINGETGFLFQGKDDLKAKISFVLENLPALDYMRKKSQERIKDRFAYKKEQEAYLSLYRDIICPTLTRKGDSDYGKSEKR